MGTKYSDEECRALDRKFEHPDETVVCPRCGKTLQYTESQWSSAVRCETKGCLHDAIRGI